MIIVGCAPSTPTVTSLVKQNSKQIRPISSSPQKTLIGTWNCKSSFVKINITPKKTISFYDAKDNTEAIKANKLIYRGDSKIGEISAVIENSKLNTFIKGEKLRADIIFINDQTIILKLSRRVPVVMTKSHEVANKKSPTSSGMDKNVKIYYDWLVRREFGDPGPVPQVSNYHRRLAVYEFVLRTGTYPSQEINYAR